MVLQSLAVGCNFHVRLGPSETADVPNKIATSYLHRWL